MAEVGSILAVRGPSSSKIAKIGVRAVPHLALIFAFSLAQAQVSLQTPEKQMAVLSSAFARTRTFPVASNGYLISFSRIGSSGNPNLVVLDSLTTGQEQQLKFSLTGATQTTILDATVVVGPPRVLLVGYFASAQSSQNQSFASLMDFSGNVSSTFNLGPYTAERVCGSGDGSFWTFGQQLGSEGLTFYRRLIAEKSGSTKLRPALVVATLDPIPVMQRYLSENEVMVGEILASPPDRAITPTIFVVDSSGIVKRLFVGKLDSSREDELLSIIRKGGA